MAPPAMKMAMPIIHSVQSWRVARIRPMRSQIKKALLEHGQRLLHRLQDDRYALPRHSNAPGSYELRGHSHHSSTNGPNLDHGGHIRLDVGLVRIGI